MADAKISALTAVTDVLATDEYVLARSGASKKITGANLIPPVTPVTSLPGSPVDNQECVLAVGSGDSTVLWRMKYDADITDSYKWRFLGGAPVFDYEPSLGNTSSATYVELNSGQPRVTIPAVGIYRVQHGCYGAGVTIQAMKINGTVDSNDDYACGFAVTATGWSFANTERTVSSIGTSADIILVYRSGGASADFYRRSVSVHPVRLG